MSVCSLLMVSSCERHIGVPERPYWVLTSGFDGQPRSGAFEFTINNKAYVGLGFGGLNNTEYLLDSWVYNVDSARWRPISTFPGPGRELSFSFSVGGKGYVGTGYNRQMPGDSAMLKDFWEYDPATDHWKQLNDFAGDPRYNALAFTDDSFPYVGTGYNGNYLGDLWRYDPTSDSWTAVNFGFPGGAREGAMTFTIHDKVFVFGGDRNGILLFDLWEFDLATKVWIDKTPATSSGNYNDFKTAVRRSDASTFVLNNNLGFVVCGTMSTSGSATNIAYQFDPSNMTWTKMPPFVLSGRFFAVSFVVENRAFIATGANGTKKYNDMLEFRLH